MTDESRIVTHDDYAFPQLQGVPTFDQQVSARMAKIEEDNRRRDLEHFRLREEMEHLKLWVHRLLNPNDNNVGDLHG